MGGAVRRPLSSLAAVLVFLSVGSSVAGVPRTPQERALGLEPAVFVLAMRSSVPWTAAAGHRQLFAIPDVGVSEVRLCADRERWGVLVGAASLTTPLGRELDVGADVFLFGDRSVAVAVGIAQRWVAIDGMRTAREPRVSAAAVIALASKLRLSYDVGVTPRDQETIVRTRLSVIAAPAAPLSTVVSVDVDGVGGLTARLGCEVQAAGYAAAGGGYDSATSSVHGYLAARAWRVRVAVGASVHATLGVSRQVWVEWGGW